MQHQFAVEPYVYDVVADLQDAGYETYIVGGAIRDLLQNREPKDYDISTAATPEEVRQVFGRRRSRLIGRRFQLVHVVCGREILEVSTFRSAPAESRHEPLTAGARKIAKLEEAENMIFNDNDFGTSEEDAWRRDFTVNALFYDPVSDELLDYTGNGVADIEAGLVRAIGDPKLRFEEDPVRMLRALKLVGQYGFQLERKTGDALRETLPLLELASVSRLSLELEKVMKSNYAGSIMRAFLDYGLLKHFLPWLGNDRERSRLLQSIELLQVRDTRVRAGFYRASVSLAMATLALPFIDSILDGNTRLHYAEHAAPNAPPPGEWDEEVLRQSFLTVFSPLSVVKRLSCSACRMLEMQPQILTDAKPVRLIRQRSFAHAMELIKIQCDANYLKCDEAFIAKWRNAISGAGGVNRDDRLFEDDDDASTAPARRKRRPRRRGKTNSSASDDNAIPEASPEAEETLIHDQLAAAADDLRA